MGDLRQLVEEELSSPVDPRVTAFASAIAAKHGAASRAVLFYGSCLRQKQLDGLMLDFYLIVSDYRAAYSKGWLAVANRLIPPNVFYAEHGGLAAKYAVLSEADFARECGVEAKSTSVWARFAQPARLVWSADARAAGAAIHSVMQAGPTLFALTRPAMSGARSGALDVFRAGFTLTYGAELRAERRGKSVSIVDADRPRFRKFGDAILKQMGVGTVSPNEDSRSPADLAHRRNREVARRAWRGRQRRGKLLSVVRLAKASATFAGGADYLAWKINRHAGTQIELKPWQRRWPLIAAISLLPRLLKSGAVR